LAGLGQEEYGTLQDRKERSQLELLIFTAGNPPEGQQ